MVIRLKHDFNGIFGLGLGILKTENKGGKEMKFKNISNKIKRFKLGKKWLDVKPGQVFESNVDIGMNESGLERVIINDIEEKKAKLSKHPSNQQNKPKSQAFKPYNELKRMTKDELNDYAAVNGLNNVSQRMKKSLIIEKILNFFKK